MSRPLPQALVAAVTFVALLGSCVAGDSPVGPVTSLATIAITPRFDVMPSAEAAPINRIRLTAYSAGPPPTVLASVEIDVNPEASEWEVALEVPVGAASQTVYILVELIHLSGGVATVEYSGSTPSFSLSSSATAPRVQQVDVVRGPSDNLNVTSVTVSPDTVTILEGDSVTLSAAVTTTGSGSSPVVYWTSLDASASVSGTGVVRGLQPGVARIVARSGTPADTARVVVRAVPTAVLVAPDTIRSDELGATVTFIGSVLDVRGAPIPGRPLLWRSLAPDVLASEGDGVFRTVRPGLAGVEALLAADTTLRAQAVVVTALAAVDVAVTKSADRATAFVGDTLEYTVSVRNEGDRAADGVTIIESLPGNVAFISATTTMGTYDRQTHRWTVGQLPLGGSAHLTVRVRATASGEASNTARLDEDALPDDGIAANNQASASVAVAARLADLSVTKTADSSSALSGDPVTFTITVSNAGPFAADSVVVSDVLSNQLTLNSSSASQGAYAGGAWTVGTLGAGATATLTIQTRISDGVSDATIENVAEVTGFTGATDPDSDDRRATATVSVGRRTADLSVTKTVDKAAAAEGDTVTFTVRVSNAGPYAMDGITLLDSIPHLLHVVAHTVSQGTADTVNSIWSVGSLAPGASAVLTLVTEIEAGAGGSTWTNVVRIRSFEGADDPDNNDHRATASVAVAGVTAADLKLTGTATPTPTVEGGTVVFDLVLTNLGPGTATDILAQGVVGTGLGVIAGSVTRGTLDTGMGSWTLDTLKAGASETLSLTAQVAGGTAGGTVQARAVILTSAPGDPNPTNDSLKVVVPVAGPDLALTKVVDLATPNLTQDVTFTLEISNPSATQASGVTVTDLLPAGLTFVSSSVPAGYDSGTGVWNVGDLPGAGTAQLMITARPTAESRGTNVVNKAAITAATPADPNPVNDTASATVTPVNQAPTADVQSVSTTETTPIDIHLSAADLDGDSLVFSVVTGPTVGSLGAFTDLVRTGATITYTPVDGSPGTYTFTYRVSDGFDSADAVVTITVTEVARSVSFTTPGNTELVAGPGAVRPSTPHMYDASGILRTGTTLAVTDLGCGSLTCTDALGERTATADGTLTFRPEVEASGTQSYTFTTDNGTTATLTITVGSTPIWYVNGTAPGATESGRSWDPFATVTVTTPPMVAGLEIASPSAPMGAPGTSGQVVHVAAGTYPETVYLTNGQRLVGAAVPFVVDGDTLAQASGTTTLNPSGTAIFTATGATVEGISITSPGFNGVSGTLDGVTLRDMTITDPGQAGITSSSSTGTATFERVTITDPGTQGIYLNNFTGALTASEMSIHLNTSGNTAFQVSGGNPTINFNLSAASLHAETAAPVDIFNTAGADITFTGGPISSNEEGILLRINPGSTIRFQNTLTISSNDYEGFRAYGGGTVEVTGSGSTIASVYQNALEIQDTDIGPGGLTFQSISGDDASILLRNTGTSGALTVTGVGTTAGSGGTIVNSYAPAIVLNHTHNPTLKNITIQNTGWSGIDADTVAGLTLEGMTINTTGLRTANVTARRGINLTDVTGSVLIDKSTVTNTGTEGIAEVHTSGTRDLTIRNSTISNAGQLVSSAGRGILLIGRVGGTGSVNLVAENNTFSGNLSNAVDVSTRDTQTAAVTLTSNQFLTNGRGLLGYTYGDAIQVSVANNTFSGNLYGDIYLDTSTGKGYWGDGIVNNTFQSPTQQSIFLKNQSPTGSVVMKILGNTITSNSNSWPVGIQASAGSTSKVAFQGNDITQTVTNASLYSIYAKAQSTGTTMCLEMGGPTQPTDSNVIPITGTERYGIFIEDDGLGTVSLAGLNGGSGTVTDPAAIVTFLQSYNTLTTVNTQGLTSAEGVPTCGIP